jgi:DNA-binding NarL/FixJ family response regulator
MHTHDNTLVTAALVDSDSAYCCQLKMVLEGNPGIGRVSVHLNLEQALTELVELAPEVILADIGLASGSPADLVKALKTVTPGAAIVVLTARRGEDSIFSALKAGASGYLFKDTPLASVADAVKDAKAGRCPLSTQAARKVTEWFHMRTPLLRSTEQLSIREQQIISKVAHGLHNREIAGALSLSEATVRAHLQTTYRKLHVHSRAQALARLRG